MKEKFAKYDYHHKGLMENSMQSIPLGNGDLGVNVWAEKEGLSLLLSKIDNWSEIYRLLKTGLVKLSFTPNPFDENTEFHFHLYDAYLSITALETEIRIYVDANAPVYRIEVTNESGIACKASIINYRDHEITVPSEDFSNYHMGQDNSRKSTDKPYPAKESADVLFCADSHTIGQYHRNLWSCYDKTLEVQGMEDYIGKETDPFLNRTFGFSIFCEQMIATETGILESQKPQKRYQISLFSLTAQTATAVIWKEQLEQLKAHEENWTAHQAYWNQEWKKTYIFADGSCEAEKCTQGFLYQRYFNLCAGRGKFPIKFNGSIFCVEPLHPEEENKNYDYRAWGAPYWLQNTRLIYWNMLFNGDYDTIKPFFAMYRNALAFAKERTKEYFGHEGAFFPETMSFFGAYANGNYGWDRVNHHKSFVANNYIRWYYCGALEVSFMMLKYLEYTNDQEFMKETAIPFVTSILTFYDQHFEKLDGTLLLSPSASLETWQDCVNDTPAIAGIAAIYHAVKAQNIQDDALTDVSDRLFHALPKLPTAVKEGLDVIAPYEINIDAARRNSENPELYVVFPYYLFGLGKEGLQTAVNTYQTRDVKKPGGWHQHAPQAAILGLVDETVSNVVSNLSQLNPKYAFPAYWGPNYDWTPDQDNGNVACVGFTHMLVQSDATTLRILPTWKEDWNVEFRLPAAQNGWVTCAYQDGEIRKLELSNIADTVEIIRP